MGRKATAVEKTDKRIMIVDDDENIRKTFALLLKKKYDVSAAGDSKEALNTYKHGSIDLLITDYKLPDQCGLDLVSRFRKLGYEGEVIMITAFPDLVNLDELSRLAISIFFVKPLDLDTLTQSIDRLMQPKPFMAGRF